MRHAFVVAQFKPLRINKNESHLLGRRLVEDRHDHGVDRHALARAGGTGNQQVGHPGEIGGYDAAIDVLAKRHGELRLRAHEFL